MEKFYCENTAGVHNTVYQESRKKFAEFLKENPEWTETKRPPPVDDLVSFDEKEAVQKAKSTALGLTEARPFDVLTARVQALERLVMKLSDATDPDAIKLAAVEAIEQKRKGRKP